MLYYRTLRGRCIDLETLSPKEQKLLFSFLGLAGVARLAKGERDGEQAEHNLERLDTHLVECHEPIFRDDVTDSPEAQVSAEPNVAVPDPDEFNTACLISIQQSLGSDAVVHVQGGLLGAIIEDLTLRLSVKKGWVSQNTIHDPSQFLKTLYRDRFRSLRAFQEGTGIEYTHASRFLRGGADVSLSSIKSAAERTDIAFDFVDRSAPPVPPAISCRDVAFERIGQRLQGLCNVLDKVYGEKEAAAILRVEYRARTGAGGKAFMAALRRARTAVRQLGLRGDGPVVLVSVSHLASDLRSDARALAWLFLALEWHWFEERGFVVALDPRDASHRPERLIEIVAEPVSRPNGEGHDSLRLYDGLIYNVLYAPDSWDSTYSEPHQTVVNTREPTDGPATQHRLQETMNHFRSLGAAVLEDPLLGRMALDVVQRWCRALDFAVPTAWPKDTQEKLFSEPQTLPYGFVEIQTQGGIGMPSKSRREEMDAALGDTKARTVTMSS